MPNNASLKDFVKSAKSFLKNRAITQKDAGHINLKLQFTQKYILQSAVNGYW